MFSFFKQVPEVSVAELSELRKRKINLIDVRTVEEYREGHIPGAVNYPLQQIDSYQTKTEPVYVVCRSGNRSKQAVSILQEKGIEAINVRGGMNQWRGTTKGGAKE